MDGRHKAGHDAGEGAGQLANKFILVANLIAADGGAAIAAGNARVVRARLADARHFWQTDLAPLPDYKDKAKKPLDQRLAKLEALGVVFHEKLGTQGERIERIEALARELAPKVGADAGLAARAARLAKADLVTEMVGEFPELQGLMGRYYASAQGEEPSVAAAIEEHYKPQGPNDRVPTSPVSIAVALADKLDTLVGFWAIDEKPTGSKDPYALRRAALGVIRIVLENGLRLPLKEMFRSAYDRHVFNQQFPIVYAISPPGRYALSDDQALAAGVTIDASLVRAAISPQELQMVTFEVDRLAKFEERPAGFPGPIPSYLAEIQGEDRDQEVDQSYLDAELRKASAVYLPPTTVALELIAFFADRLKVYLRDQGARHDLIDAVFALPGQDDLLMIVRRVEALGRLLDTEDGKNLLAGYRRAANILRAEEKKDGAGAFAGAARSGRARPAGGKGARRRSRRGGRGGARARGPRGFRRRDARALRPSRAGRRLLPRCHRQRRRSRLTPQSPAPARRTARRGARRGGLFEDRGIAHRIASSDHSFFRRTAGKYSRSNRRFHHRPAAFSSRLA